MSKSEELAKQAEERAIAYQQAAACRKPVDADSVQMPSDFAGKGHGASPEQWPDGACGCGVWGSR